MKCILNETKIFQCSAMASFWRPLLFVHSKSDKLASDPAVRFRQAVASPKSTIHQLERLAARLPLDDLRVPDPHGRTALALAAQANNLDVVEWLMFDEGHEEAEISRVSLARECSEIALTPCREQDAAGETILHIAAANGSVEVRRCMSEMTTS